MGVSSVIQYSDGVLVHGDCLDWLINQPDDCYDMTFGSPPYESARSYGIDFSLEGQDWVDWMVKLWAEFHRVTKGLVAMVVEGMTKDRRWTATPALLMADLHRAGYHLRKPPLYVRWGVPGSGGRDWLRNRYEFVVCTTKGPLPWSDPVACGEPPKCPPGGDMSYRMRDGDRVKVKALQAKGLSQIEACRTIGLPLRCVTSGRAGGDLVSANVYVPPEKANPGNIIDCGSTGLGGLGSKIAHENEAPFAEKIVDFFIRSFCPRDGVVFDPFVGGGTTVAVARQCRRKFVGVDIRSSQIELARLRLEEAHFRKGFDI